MSYLVGILISVSQSMKKSFGGGSGLREELGPLTKSIYELIEDIIKHDISNVKVFAIGFGANCDTEIFDIFQSIDAIHSLIEQYQVIPWNCFVEVNDKSIYNGERAIECVGKRLSVRSKETPNSSSWPGDLAKYFVKTFLTRNLYGSRSPLNRAANKALDLFSATSAKKKFLFIISDGVCTDEDSEKFPREELKQLGVKVIGCYVSRDLDIAPKRLYNFPDVFWDENAKYLFNICSTVKTQLLSRAILMKQKWTIDFENNETKLFLQVNHPENFKEARQFVETVFCCQDALIELIQSISLDKYINQCTAEFKPHEQEGGTCYANAAAAVIHLALSRIIGRTVPEFETLREDLRRRYGNEGASTLKVLQDVCPIYGLRCREINVREAMEAITAKRTVVATFRLTDEEWDAFDLFFETNRKGILQKRHLDISKRSSSSELSGHAVVLTTFDSKCFRLMNSWGGRWADDGFFRVETTEMLDMKFIDVYWTEDDLSEMEKKMYKDKDVVKKLRDSLEFIKKAKYRCPYCQTESNVTEFIPSTLSSATCPSCFLTFRLSISDKGNGNILALNIYLTSIAHQDITNQSKL